MIHPSAPVRSSVLQSIRAGFEYSGQKCSALSRLYVPESLWPAFSATLLEEVAKLKVGSPEEWDSFMGPVISQVSYDKIMGLIQQAKDAGDKVLIGGTGK